MTNEFYYLHNLKFVLADLVFSQNEQVCQWSPIYYRENDMTNANEFLMFSL